MSTATLVPLAKGRHVYDLEAQARAFGASAPQRLLVCCSEPDPSGLPDWERALAPAFCLRSPGASLEDLGLHEALRHAVLDLGVRELVLVLHSRCSHVVAPPSPQEVARERGLPFMERLVANRRRAEHQLAAAREAVRDAIRSLDKDPVLRGVESLGLVAIAESGALLAYDSARDDFEPLS